jgi:hypothetical protein
MYIQAPPTVLLSKLDPTIAVLPSALTATDTPCDPPEPLVPTNLFPCCAVGYGVPITVNFPELAIVPPEVVIDIVPAAVPGIAMKTNCEGVFDMIIAGTVPIVTDEVLFRFAPLMVMRVPTGPTCGANEAMTGACAKSFPMWIKNKMIRITLRRAINQLKCLL